MESAPRTMGNVHHTMKYKWMVRQEGWALLWLSQGVIPVGDGVWSSHISLCAQTRSRGHDMLDRGKVVISHYVCNLAESQSRVSGVWINVWHLESGTSVGLRVTQKTRGHKVQKNNCRSTSLYRHLYKLNVCNRECLANVRMFLKKFLSKGI